MADDYSNDIATTGQLTVNEALTASVDATGDQDWFAVELQAGVQYRIDATGALSSDGTVNDPHLGGIFDAAGSEVVGANYSGGLGREARLWFTPETSGTYFVSAGVAEGVSPRDGESTYQIRVANADGWDDAPGDATSAVRLDPTEPESVFQGEIDERNDIDWIGVDATPGVVYRFTMDGGAGIPSGRLDPRLDGIFASDGTMLAPASSGTTASAQGYAFVTSAQTVFAGAASEGDVRDGLYTMSVDTEGFIRLGVGREGFGTINHTGDLDFFQLQLTAGQEYRIDAVGVTARDAHIGGIYGPDGSLLPGTENYSGGLGRDARIWFTPEADGLYTVAAGAAPGVSGDIGGRYRLTVRDEWDSVGTTPGTAGTAELGAPYTGSLDGSRDVDWVGIAMNGGSTYRVTLAGGQSTRGDNLVDVRIDGIYDENGTRLADTISGSGASATALFEAPGTGIYYVAAGSEGATRDGQFDLTVSEETVNRLAVGQSAGGTIDAAGDQDLFTLSLTGGTAYRIDVTGIFDSHIGGIYGPDGALIDGTTNFSGGIGRDARLWFVPEEDGEYILSVGVAPGLAADVGRRYEVSVDDSWDDSAEDPAGAAAIELGSTYDGEIDDDNDVDWIGVLLEAGTLYEATAEGIDSTRSVGSRVLPLNTQIEGIYDVNGVRVADAASGDDSTASQIYLPTQTGTYYVAVAAEGEADNGNYRLSVAPAATATLTLGQPTPTYIFEPGGQRWYEVEMEAGTRYRIDSVGGADAHIGGIIGPDGAVAPGTENFSGGIGRDARLFFTPETDGTYYVSAGANPNLDSLGRRSYTIEVDDDYDDFADDATTTGTLAPNGGLLNGALDEAGDVDWIAVDVTAGGAYQLRIAGGSSTASDADGNILPVDPALGGVFAGDGTQVMPGSSGEGTIVDTSFVAAEDGTLYVAVQGETAQMSGNYTVQLWQDTVPAGTDSTEELGTGTTQGRFEIAGDQDWYRMTLTEGESYGFAAESSGDAPARILGLYDADGTLVPGTDTGGPLRGEAPAAGDYFLAVGAADPALTGTYNVTSLGNDDFSASPALAGTVDVNGFAAGTVRGGRDRDWFAVDLQAGRSYRVDLEGNRTSGGTLYDPYLYGLFDDEGLYLGLLNDDSGFGRNSRADITVAEDGRYYLAAGGYGFSQGTYTLTVTDLEDDHGDDNATATILAPDEPISGYIGEVGSVRDLDRFALDVEAGETYLLMLSPAEDLYGLLYPQLRLFTDNTPGAFDYDGRLRDAELEFTVQEDTTYFAEVADRYRAQGDGGHYTLVLEQQVFLTGTEDADWLTLPQDGRFIGADGLGGNDMMSFAGLATGIRVDLGAGTVAGGGAALRPGVLALDNIESVTGTSYDDIFRGSDGADRVRALGGRDMIFGSAGRDRIDGGTSNDTLTYMGSEEGVSVSLFRGRGYAGDAAGDQIENVENLTGSFQDDMIWGDNAINRLDGGYGDDTIVGAGGDDYILAGFGTDVIVFSGNRDEYAITQDGIRTEVEHLNDGVDGTDIIGHAEVLRFADGDFVL